MRARRGDPAARRPGPPAARDPAGLAEQTEVSELEQARRAVLEERARIARELHDVVAHHMSLIAVRAETAPYRLGGLPEPARDEFTAIASAAREALTEMRRLLGVLRSELADARARAAAGPGRRSPSWCGAARRAGMAVHYLPPEPGSDWPARPGRRAGRVPDRAGGPGQRDPARAGRAGDRAGLAGFARSCRCACTTTHRPRRRPRPPAIEPGPSDAGADAGELGRAGTGWPGCGSGPRCWAASSPPAPTADGGFAVTATMPYGGRRVKTA